MIENRLNAILSGNDDIAIRILHMCEELYTNEKVSLNSQLQNELRIRLMANKMEEEVWDRLLSIMSPNELSGNVLNYLIQNRISLQTLCHMQLQDEWLKKLIVYDDAPLYTLAVRYYLTDQHSVLEFLQFYDQYLCNRNDISLHLLDVYGNAHKRKLLIFLCSNHMKFEHREKLQWHQVADQVRGLTNSKDIEAVYKEYQNIGTVLIEIAINYFTPEEILLELSSIKGVTYASEIRKNSKNTLMLKQIVEQK